MTVNRRTFSVKPDQVEAAAQGTAQLAGEIEAQLVEHTLPGLEGVLPRTEYVLPHYQGLGVANLPATIAALLGGELPGGCPPLRPDLWADWGEGLERVILVVVDALGYRQLLATMDADESLVFHKLARAGRLVPLATTFPSTTTRC